MGWTISENFGTYQGSVSYILDGNANNCWRADSRAGAGQYVLLTSDQSVYVTTVQYVTTQSSEIFGSGAYLQYSTDGNNFTDIAQFNGSSGQTFTVNSTCRYLRIYCKSGSGYVSISELIITTGTSPGGGGGGSSSGESKTNSYTPAAFDSAHSYYSASGTNNPIGEGSTSGSYAQIYFTTGSRAQTYFSYSFDLSDIPQNAIIKSVQCRIKAYTNGTNSSRIATRKVQLYSGDTAKGSSYNVAASTTPFAIDGGTWTRAELAHIKLRFDFVRGTSYTTSNYYVRFYGAELEVEYEIPALEEPVLYFNDKGKMCPVSTALMKVSGEWQVIKPESIKQLGTNYILVQE